MNREGGQITSGGGYGTPDPARLPSHVSLLPFHSSRFPFPVSRPTFHPRCAFSLIEMLVVVAIIAILAALLLPALTRSKASAWRADCVGHLRQLGTAAQLYWDDNHGNCFNWRLGATNGGTLYWFGWISSSGGEGNRAFDLSSGVLYPYVADSKVRICPSLNYALAQFKFKGDGAIYSFGYSLVLSPSSRLPTAGISRVLHPTDTALFADAAQVNDFQAPASPSHPMLEEWYYLDNPTNYPSPNYYPHGHFRHSQRANVGFCDGHVGPEKALPDSIDPKLPSQFVGRLRPQILTLP